MGPRRHGLHRTKRHFWILNVDVCQEGRNRQKRKETRCGESYTLCPVLAESLGVDASGGRPGRAARGKGQSNTHFSTRHAVVSRLLQSECETPCCRLTHTCWWCILVYFVFRKESVCMCLCVLLTCVWDWSLLKLNVNKGAATCLIDMDGEMLPDQKGRALVRLQLFLFCFFLNSLVFWWTKALDLCVCLCGSDCMRTKMTILFSL